jgi:diacylglycerol kinase family enzyme
MGGDGTFREVAAGLYGSTRRAEVALAMLPTGTANDQGKSFGLQARDEALDENLAIVLRNKQAPLDCGSLRALDADGKELARTLFFDSCGWGISARVLARRNADRERVAEHEHLRELYRDELVYAGALLKTFFESYAVSDKFNAELDVDGQARYIDGLSDLIIKNTRIYAGAWVFDRDSKPDDGLFEVVPFRGRRDWVSKALIHHEHSPLREGLLDAIGLHHTPQFRAARIDLRFDVPPEHAGLAAQIDGDEFIASPRAVIEVIPRALNLIVGDS